MPLSVWKGRALGPAAPRNQPAKPGLPAPEEDPTSLTRTRRLADCSRRVAPPAWPTGGGVFLSAGPWAWMGRLMGRGALSPEGREGPRPSAARTMGSLVSGTVVVVGSVLTVVGAA